MKKSPTELREPSSRIELNEKKLSLVQNHVPSHRPLQTQMYPELPVDPAPLTGQPDCTFLLLIAFYSKTLQITLTTTIWGGCLLRGHNWRPFGANQLRPKAATGHVFRKRARARKRLFKFTLIYYFNGSAQMIIARQPSVPAPS